MSVMTRDRERGALFLVFFIVPTKVRTTSCERSTAFLSSTIAAISPAAALYRTEPIIALAACAIQAHVFSTVDQTHIHP